MSYDPNIDEHPGTNWPRTKAEYRAFHAKRARELRVVFRVFTPTGIVEHGRTVYEREDYSTLDLALTATAFAVDGTHVRCLLLDHGRNAPEYLVKAALGLPAKLEPYLGEPKLLGHIAGLPIYDWGRDSVRGRRRRHRLYAQVAPNQYTPVGRLHQYHVRRDDWR